jgi:hypothetical protein
MADWVLEGVGPPPPSPRPDLRAGVPRWGAGARHQGDLRAGKWRQALTIWAAAVAPTGSGKTPALNVSCQQDAVGAAVLPCCRC